MGGTKDRMIEAAVILIESHGVNGTSVDDILKASGTGKSQFYHYFGNKEGLVAAVVERWRTTLIDEQLSALASLDSWEGIESWLDAMAEGRAPSGLQLATLAAEIAPSNDALRRQVEGVYAEWNSYLARGLATMQTRGLLRAGADPRGLAQHAIATLHGGGLLARISGRPVVLRRTLDHTLAYLRSFA